MDSVDMVDLGYLLQTLVTVEAMRGANEAFRVALRTDKQPPFPVEQFAAIRRQAERTLEHMEWHHNRD